MLRRREHCTKVEKNEKEEGNYKKRGEREGGGSGRQTIYGKHEGGVVEVVVLLKKGNYINAVRLSLSLEERFTRIR